MASDKHLELSNFIKSVHKNLKLKSLAVGTDQAWREHCADEGTLKKYGSAMKDLALKHWEQSLASKTGSRVLWTHSFSRQYFQHDIFKYREKEKEIAEKANIKLHTDNLNVFDPAKKPSLLDVGSCYNPFRAFADLDVVAVDIAPAQEDVFKCDFLNLILGDKKRIEAKSVLELQKCSFEVVVFSLLLEYLPSADLRKICCRKAYDLLKTEGVLIIITPDSNHVGANAKFMKSWRFVLAKMGFARIKYEKLPHIHCMAFRKSISPEIPRRWVELHREQQIYDEIFIPRDFSATENEPVADSTRRENCLLGDRWDFSDFPDCNVFV